MKSRYGFLSTLTAIVLFILLETLSVFLMVRGGVVQRFKVMGAVRSVESWFWQHTGRIESYFSLRPENERLSAENLRLRTQLARYAAAAAELDSAAQVVEPRFTFLGATVIRNTVDRQRNYLILDRGEQDGVEPGMGVVTSRGVVGIVDAVSRRYAHVISLLGAGQSVSAKLAGDGPFGPMAWTGLGPTEAVLREIPVHVEAVPGDTVCTSGYSTLYPPDIPLGRVVSSRVSQGASQELSIELFEDFRSLHYVYVVKNNHREELEELYEKAR